MPHAPYKHKSRKAFIYYFDNTLTDKYNKTKNILNLFFPIKHKSKILFLFLLLPHTLLFFGKNVPPAVNYDISFNHLTTTNGLLQNTINYILQDSQGFVWFGNNFTLYRWDGFNIKTYKYDASTNTTISRGSINCIYEDATGNLWIGTSIGNLSRYNRDSDTFTRFSPSNNQAGHFSSILRITKIKNHIITLVDNGQVYYFNEQKNKLIPFTLLDENNKNISYFANTFYYDKKDTTLWVGCKQKALKISDIIFNTDTITAHCTTIQTEDAVISIIKHPDNYFFFGTDTKGLYKYDNKQKTIKHSYYTNNHQVSCLTIDSLKNLWIGTEGDGIYLKENNTNHYYHIEPDLHNPNSLSSGIIRYLYTDKHSGIWIGTYNGGINYYYSNLPEIHHYVKNTEKGKINSNSILSICKLPDNKLLLGTDRGGLEIFSPRTNTYSHLDILPGQTTDDVMAVTDLTTDSLNNIYIGTYGYGIFIYNINTGKVKHYKKGDGKNQLKSNDIKSIKINNSDILVSTLNKGIFKFEKETGNFYPLDTTNNNLSDKYIVYTTIDHANNIWIGTSGYGIIKISNNGHTYSYYNTQNSALLSNIITCIIEDSKNNIWVGTNNSGLSILLHNTDNFFSYTKRDGLYDNSVESIIEDDNGYLWAGSKECIMRIKLQKDSLSVKHITINSNFIGNEFNRNAVIKTNDGTLFFGGTNGLYYFTPRKINFNTEIGNMLISNVSVLYHNKKHSANIPMPPGDTKTIYLNHNISILNIEFSLCDFYNSKANTFTYKLAGYNDNWINAGTSHNATYTNLSPGKYTFLVKGTNSIGKTTPTPARLNIIIEPPFWGTIWFRIITAAILLSIIWLIYYVRLKAYALREMVLKRMIEKRTKELSELNHMLNEQNEEIYMQNEELQTNSERLITLNNELEAHKTDLERLISERTGELLKAKEKAEESEQLKIAFLANMSHEIRTPLNAIIGFTNILATQDLPEKDKKEYLDIINTNSNDLLILVDDILTLSRIEAGQFVITKDEFNIISLFKEIASHWHSYTKHNNFDNVKFEYKNLIDQKEIIINSSSTSTKQIINNLIDNALKFTNEGSVTLVTRTERKFIIIEVHDTGIGIQRDNLQKIFDRFKKIKNENKDIFRGAGLGLTIVQRLVDMLGYEISVKSDLNKGSSFFVKIPFR